MAEKNFKRGDRVVLIGDVANLTGITAQILFQNDKDELIICVITDDFHPSGHSQRGTLVAFPAKDLDFAPPPPANPVPDGKNLPEISSL